MHEPWSPPPPSPFTVPPPVIDSGRRDVFGWLLLFAFFAILVTSALYQSFNPEKPEKTQKKVTASNPKFEGAAQQLKFAFVMGALGEESKDQRDKLLEEVVNDVIEAHTTDVTAARIYAAARTELGKPLKNEDLAALSSSKDADLRALAEAYRPATLTPERAQELRSQIKGEDFLDEVARIHVSEKAGDQAARKELPVGRWALGMGIVVAALLLFPVGLVLWGIYYKQVTSGRWRPLGYPVFYPTLLAADRDALRAVLIMVAWMLVAPLIVLPLLNLPEILEQGLASVLVALFIALIYRLRIGGVSTTWTQRLGERQPIGKLVLWGVAGWIANIPVLAVLAVLTNALSQFVPEPTHPVNSEIAANPTVPAMIGILLVAVIGAPLIEETFFRGMLFPALGRVLGSPVWGILLSSFLFASIHPQGIAGWPPLMGVAAVAAGLTYQTRSIIPAMIFHGIHNASLLVVALLLR